MMIWVSFSAGRPGSLTFIDKIIDRSVYLDILKRKFVWRNRNLILASTLMRTWLLDNEPPRLQTPPQNPGINSIAQFWNCLNKKNQEHRVSIEAELKEVLKQEWK